VPEAVSIVEGKAQDFVVSTVSLLTNIVRALVLKRERVVVRAVSRGDVTTLLISVAAEDVGKVLGKQGRTARSLRTVINATSRPAKHRFELDIQPEDLLVKVKQSPA
jgi:predicted RNA-binding protein YlqC (UPF0109 family)